MDLIDAIDIDFTKRKGKVTTSLQNRGDLYQFGQLSLMFYF